MNATAMNLNHLFKLAAPKTREDLLALGNEMLAELKIINGHFDSIFEDADCLTDA
jgi:hypothetical protein